VMNPPHRRCPGTAARTRPLRTAFRAGAACLLLALALGSPPAASPCRAQDLTVRAYVDKDVATLEDQITLTVSVSGGQGSLREPQLPPLPDFRVVAGGSSSRIEIVNFRKSSSVHYTYFLLPNKAGIFTIGPVRVQQAGQVRESRPIQVKVLPPQENPEERPAVFITQEVDEKDPYVSQQVVYTFRFFQRARVVEAQWNAPDLQGFWVEELGKERSYETILNGQNYSVTEIKRALFPLESGPRQIPEGSLTCKLVTRQQRTPRGRSLFDEDFFSGTLFGGMGQTESRILRAAAVPMDVRPLPAEGRPADFQGLVGAFRVEASVGEPEIRRGDSTTLTVTVSGEGNLRDLVSVGPQEIPGFKIYPDKPSFEVRAQGNKVLSTRVFKIALVPLEEGTLEIPPIGIPYFDPAAGAYRVARTDPILLAVREGDAADALPLLASPLGSAGAQSNIRILGTDILPIHTGRAGARAQVPAGRALLPYAGVLLAPPLAYFLCFAVKRRKDRLKGDPHLVRKKEARRRALQELKEARRRMGELEDRAFYSLLTRSITGLIGDKCNLPARAFTPEEIRRCLRETGLPPDTVEGIHAFLEELEYSRFVSGHNEAGQREVQFKKARGFVNLLDRKLS